MISFVKNTYFVNMILEKTFWKVKPYKCKEILVSHVHTGQIILNNGLDSEQYVPEMAGLYSLVAISTVLFLMPEITSKGGAPASGKIAFGWF